MKRLVTSFFCVLVSLQASAEAMNCEQRLLGASALRQQRILAINNKVGYEPGKYQSGVDKLLESPLLTLGALAFVFPIPVLMAVDEIGYRNWKSQVSEYKKKFGPYSSAYAKLSYENAWLQKAGYAFTDLRPENARFPLGWFKSLHQDAIEMARAQRKVAPTSQDLERFLIRLEDSKVCEHSVPNVPVMLNQWVSELD
ncbi:MAG: hypothetical protein EOP06_02260 [Proteobacteria bacterium]|nr:MAG: hypothetical protein EOP06_02260 [Pseudomonadota bacterium]